MKKFTKKGKKIRTIKKKKDLEMKKDHQKYIRENITLV